MANEKNDKTRLSHSIFLQLFFVTLPFTLFYNTALVFRGFINLSPVIGILIAIIMNSVSLSLLIGSIYLWLKRQSTCRDPIFPRLRSHFSVLIVAILFSVLAFTQFGSIPRYDASIYYSALITATETFRFDLSSLLSSFLLMWHPTQGLSLFLAIGEMLFPKQCVGVYGITLILTLLAVFCLYDITGRLIPEASKGIRAAGVAIFAFCPYVLGLFSYITPDYYLTVFFIMMIWAFQRDWHILGAFLALVVCFCKEPGILFVAAFLLVSFSCQISQFPGKGFIRKAICFLWPSRFLLYGTVPVLFVIYYKTIGQMDFMTVRTNLPPLRWDSDGLHCFGFNPSYIIARMAQYLIFNFFWIGLLCAFLLLVYLYNNVSKHPVADSKDINAQVPTNFESAHVPVACGIFASTSVYLVFSCIYITYLCPRYAVCMSFPISLVCVKAICSLIKKKRLAAALLALIACINIGQNYMNMDPTITLTCTRLFVGHQYIYSPTTSWYNTQYYLGHLGEKFVFNRTYAYAEELTNRALQKLSIREDDTIFFMGLDWIELYVLGDPDLIDNPIYWDPVKQKLTYDSAADGAFIPRSIAISLPYLEENEELPLPDRFYMMTTAHTPYEQVEDILRRGYVITDSFIEENYIGYITVYTIEKEKTSKE